VNGEHKTLRGYWRPVNLSCFPTGMWITSEKECWDVGAALTDVPLTPARTTSGNSSGVTTGTHALKELICLS
jgi:hypothetical protein